ncbi:MAG: hypothetical protein EBU46_00800 [Nitrosomonadaceae bacterium]|nr:hypothetical protein [Nitrosomonadaceae bacterium]
MPKAPTTEQQFVFSQPLSDVNWEPPSSDEEAIKQKIFGGMDPDKMVDAYEQQLGIKTKPNAEAPKLLWKTIMLSPGTDNEDSEHYCNLMNDIELYPERRETSTWTQRGEYKIFVIYAEDQRVKEARMKKQQMAVEAPTT